MSSPRRLLLLVFVLLALFALAYQPRQRIGLDLTAPSAEKFLSHFYPAENGARWTESLAGVWLPGLGGGNLSWRIGLTLSGPRPGRFDTPARVAVRVNGGTIAEFDAGTQEQDYEWEIRPWQLGLNGDVLLEIESSTSKPLSDEREFGVRVSRVWLDRAAGIALPSTRGFLLTLALIGCFAAILTMSANAGLMSLSRMRISEFIDPFRNSYAWIFVAIWSALIAAESWNRYETTWWLQIIAVGFLLTTVLIWAIARIVSKSHTRDQVRALVIIFTIAALVRIPLDLGSGYEGEIASYGKQGDIATYIALAWKTAGHGIQSGYLEVNGSPPSDNPPVLLYPFWFFGWLYQKLISPLFGRTPVSYPEMLRFMLRLPGLAADLLAGAFIFRALREARSVTFNSALLAASAYLFNPAIIFDSAYWGQTQCIHALFMLVSLIALWRRAYAWAGGTLAVAILTKPQAIAVAPLVLLLTIRERGTLRLLFGGVIATAVITAPFIVAGDGATVVEQYTQTTKFHPFIAVNAHNLWWFVTGGKGWSPDTASIGPLKFRVVGFLLFSCAMVLSLLVVWRDREKLFLVAAYEALAFFMLNTQIHENHLLAMFAPLVVAAACDREAWWFYCALTVTFIINMTLHDPKLFAFLGYPPNEIYGGPAWASARWINSAVQTLLFGAFTIWLIVLLMPRLRLKLARAGQ